MSQDSASLAIRIRAELLEVHQVAERGQRLLAKAIEQNEYRALRHVIRNVYTFNLKPSRIQELMLVLPDCHHAITQDLFAFCEFLFALNSKESP